jgi:gliding motility-associated-like protein
MELNMGGHISRVARRAFVCMGLLVTMALHAQELVPDPGFEQYTSCPEQGGFGQLYRSRHWYALRPSPDLYNCGVGVPTNVFGHQQPFAGSGYAGAAGGEIMAVKLLQPMRAGHQYQVRFWCSLANSGPPSAALGCLFSPDSLCNDNGPWLPQMVHSGAVLSDTLGWMLVTGLYTAQGCERYMALVRGDTLPAYYYFDEVSVTCADPLGCPPMACPDTVDLFVPNVFTPNADGYNERFWFSAVRAEMLQYEYTIYDRWGEVVATGDERTGMWDGSTVAGPAAEGVYYYILSARRKPCERPVVRKGFVHLLR